MTLVQVDLSIQKIGAHLGTLRFNHGLMHVSALG